MNKSNLLSLPVLVLCLLAGISDILLLLEVEVLELSLDAEGGLLWLKRDDEEDGVCWGLLLDGD